LLQLEVKEVDSLAVHSKVLLKLRFPAVYLSCYALIKIVNDVDEYIFIISKVRHA